jgi:hypothetical protein
MMKVRVVVVVDVVVVLAVVAARTSKPAANLPNSMPCNNTITHLPIGMLALGAPWMEKTFVCVCSA